MSLAKKDGVYVLRIPAAMTPTPVKVLMAIGSAEDLAAFAKTSYALKPLIEGGAKRWPEVLKTTTKFGKNDGPFAVDTFALPVARVGRIDRRTVERRGNFKNAFFHPQLRMKVKQKAPAFLHMYMTMYTSRL